MFYSYYIIIIIIYNLNYFQYKNYIIYYTTVYLIPEFNLKKKYQQSFAKHKHEAKSKNKRDFSYKTVFHDAV